MPIKMTRHVERVNPDKDDSPVRETITTAWEGADDFRLIDGKECEVIFIRPQEETFAPNILEHIKEKYGLKELPEAGYDRRWKEFYRPVKGQTETALTPVEAVTRTTDRQASEAIEIKSVKERDRGDSFKVTDAQNKKAGMPPSREKLPQGDATSVPSRPGALK